MIKKVLLVFMIIRILFPVNVYGSELVTIDDFDMSEGIEIVENSTSDDLDLDKIVELISNGNIFEVIKMVAKSIYYNSIGEVFTVEKTIVNLLLVVLLSAFYTNFANVFSKDNVSETAFYICYLVLLTLMVSLFDTFCNITADFIRLLLGFVGGIIPAYFLSVAVMGQVSATGFYQLILVIISVSEFIFLKVLIPMIKVYVAISLVNNISREDFLSGITSVIHNFVNFANKALIGIVTGINLIQGLILPSMDGVKNTTLKKIMGSLPVIGDGTDAVTGILLGSANLIKNTIGVFGIVIIILICFIPYIKISICSVSVQIASAIMQPVADARIVQGVNCIITGTRALAKIIISAGLLFIISLAIMCMMTNYRG